MLTVHTIGEEISLNEMRRNVPAMLSGGKWTYFIGGEWRSERVFNRMFPKAVYRKPEPKGENVCRKHLWMK